MQTEKYIQIKEFLREAIEGTEWEGHVFVVGGCVRDEILGHEIKDIDLCVSKPAGGVLFAEWLRDSGLTKGEVTVYPSYGTAMAHLAAFPDVELEFVQTRKEKYIDKSCRNPITAFGSVEEDALRRDLTINALSINLSTGEIVDVTGRGVQDIKDHIIRTPVDPDITYDDDPLRILRCIRFASRYGWEVDKDTFDGMARNAHRLSIICKERIQIELDKMLTCAHPVMAMELLRRTGAMHYAFPVFEQAYDMTQNEYHSGTVWQHTMDVLGAVKSDSLEVRMAALLHDIGKVRTRSEKDGKVHFIGHEKESAKMVGELLRPLKYSNEIIRKVSFLVGKHMIAKAWGDDLQHMKSKALRKLQYQCKSEEMFRDLMLLMDADNSTHAEGYRLCNQVRLILDETEKMKSEGSAMFGYRLPVDGKDVMELKGIKAGPEVREVLEYLIKVAYVDPLLTRDGFIKHLVGYKLKK